MQFRLDPNLSNFGWSPFLTQSLLSLCAEQDSIKDLVPARITAEQRAEYTASDGSTQYRATLSGRLRHGGDLAKPCVGDFVLLSVGAPSDLARIDFVFERTTLFRRKVADARSRDQPIAANIDLALVVCAIPHADADPHAMRHGISARRIERYLSAIRQARAEPLVIVNKADLSADSEQLARELGEELGGAQVLRLSAQTGLGFDELIARISSGTTAVLVGSSGVGKSSIMNRLLGAEAQRVQSVRETDTRGRHTTTHRELFVLPNGGIVIDTPGMREFALYADEDAPFDTTGFDEIDELSQGCRFRDCQHRGEPGCRVLEAVKAGIISSERLEHAQRLQRELRWQQIRQDQRLQSMEKKNHRAHSRSVREGQKRKGRE